MKTHVAVVLVACLLLVCKLSHSRVPATNAVFEDMLVKKHNKPFLLGRRRSSNTGQRPGLRTLISAQKCSGWWFRRHCWRS